MMVTGEQIRAARALLRIEQDALAELAHVSVTTIRRFEARGGGERVADATVGDIILALEQAGAEFIKDGVRRSPQPRGDRDALFRELRHIAEKSAALLAATPVINDADLYGDDGLPR